jgi:hypothetical protein
MAEKYKVYAQDESGQYYVAICRSKAELNHKLPKIKSDLQRRNEARGWSDPKVSWVKD